MPRTTSMLLCFLLSASAFAERPNILWITSEDIGPQLGCYGDAFATSPNIDALARDGLRFNHCWSNAPVCAPARTTIITGMYPTCFGASNMRSRAVRLSGTLLLPELLRNAGYYCSNNSKEDYNFNQAQSPWADSSTKAHWRNRPPGAPFFSVFNLQTTHESQIRVRPHQLKHQPERVPLPPYHPDLPEVRRDWTQYYDKIEEMDEQVGKILAQLHEDGLSESTIIFYFGDHGSGMPRSKRWLYQGGLHVPMIVHVPRKWLARAGSEYHSGGSSDRLISFVDLAPTVLHLIGEAIPEYLQGRPFLGEGLGPPPKFAFGFRDRMDERIDMSRSVRSDRFLYIRNFYPHRPQGAYLNYMFQTPTTLAWYSAMKRGELNAAQSAFWRQKPVEELYDLHEDLHQIHNLADSSSHAIVRRELAEALLKHMTETRDHGVIPESIVKSAKVDPSWSFEEMVEAAFAADPRIDKLIRPTSSNPVVRFWSVQQRLGRAAIIDATEGKEFAAQVESLLEDPEPSVRIAAAELVANWGTEEEQHRAIAILKAFADLRSEGSLNALAAMNALANLGVRWPEVVELPSDDPAVEKVYSEYIDRMKEYLSQDQPHVVHPD